jgi:hypothetical protein
VPVALVGPIALDDLIVWLGDFLSGASLAYTRRVAASDILN